MSSSSVKIFLSYHKPSVLLKSSVFEPIFVGKARSTPASKEKLSFIVGDDTGDNISIKNDRYCELTAQYWAWKQCSANYIGFMHYRRHLSFKNKGSEREDRWGVVSYKYLTQEYVYENGLYDEYIENFVDQYDLITVKPWEVSKAGSKTLYDHYRTSDAKLHIEDYDLAIEILKAKYPEMSDSADEYNQGSLGYFTNIFVMRQNVFNQYSKFLFDILFELESRISDRVDGYNVQEKRVYGYISEWLFGIFITHVKHLNRLKIKELPRTFIEETEQEEVEPIVVCCASDDKYAMPLGVSLTSVKLNKIASDNLYVYIIDGGISSENKSRLLSLGSDNFHILFVRSPKLEDVLDTKIIEDKLKGQHFKIATYYRLFLGDILPKYVKRVIYLDCDTVVRSSLSSFYTLDLTQKAILGVKDVLEESNTKRLGLACYINAGVALINLETWRSEGFSRKMVNYFLENHSKILWHDQDIINATVNDNIGYVDPRWNAQTASYPGSEEQNEIGKTAHIIHYVSDRKPWIVGNKNPFESIFWDYLRQSPFASLFESEKKQAMAKKYIYQQISSTSFWIKECSYKLSLLILPMGTRRRLLIKRIFRSFSR